jgi:hypothetical protein
MNKTTNEAVKQNETQADLAEVKTVELKNVIGGMAQGWAGGAERGALSIGHQMRN